MNTHLLTNRLGRQYWVNPDDSFYMQRFGKGTLPYQTRNLKFLRAVCPTPEVVLDVGMNIGSNTIEYATWAAHVHGFEPFPSTFDIAKVNIEHNQKRECIGRYIGDNDVSGAYEHFPDEEMGWWINADGSYASLEMTGQIHLYNCGLGDECTVLGMEDHRNNAGHNCMASNSKNTYDKVQVPVNTIDSFDFDTVDFIKIDVEGFELAVVRGARNTIKSCRPVLQIELIDKQCMRFGYHPQAVYDYIFNEFDDYVVCDFGGMELGEEWVNLKGCIDYYFMPRETFEAIDPFLLAKNCNPKFTFNYNANIAEEKGIARSPDFYRLSIVNQVRQIYSDTNGQATIDDIAQIFASKKDLYGSIPRARIASTIKFVEQEYKAGIIS